METIRERPPLRLRLMLELLGVSQADLAKGAGVSRSTVNKAVAGKLQRRKTQERIAEALRSEITPEAIL